MQELRPDASCGNTEPDSCGDQWPVFNKNTGDASASGKVVFETPQATGSAMGVEYISSTGTMTLRSAVEVAVTRPQSRRG